jgi:hypothetical protein
MNIFRLFDNPTDQHREGVILESSIVVQTTVSATGKERKEMTTKTGYRLQV